MDAPVTVAIDALERLQTGSRPLVVDEESGALCAALSARGADAAEWLRRAVRAEIARPWPPCGPFTAALLRLPKAKESLAFALHAVASELPVGAPTVVFGANVEGVRSAVPLLDEVAERIETVLVKRHCRVLAGSRRASIPDHRSNLAAWRREGEIMLGGRPRRWISYPGVFARGDVDAGTALLVASLPALRPGTRVLDFAAGTGVIAAAILDKASQVAVDMLEVDCLALAAAQENVPNARAVAGSSLAAVGDCIYDFIVSNPPLHDGVRASLAVLETLVCDAPSRLSRGGELRLVTQRHVPTPEILARVFGASAVAHIAESGGFRVHAARKT
jgi:16S rRNA (guanine1207-N2)-methyltransferase